MTELCVMCGATLPTESGSQVCRTCELTAGLDFMKFRCPECGEMMEVWSKRIVSYTPGRFDSYPYLAVDLIYHCDKCGCDWDSEYTLDFGDVGQTGPKRHYWG